MARIRTIKPSFFRDHDIAELPLSTRLTFIGLWTYVDDEGRGIDDPRLVKGDLWQLDDKHTVAKVNNDLKVLAERGRIERYEINGRRYLRVVNWTKHQRINRPTPSQIPASFSERSGKPPTSVTDGSGQEGNRDIGKGSIVGASPNEPPDTMLDEETVELGKVALSLLRGEGA